jgi:PAS domain S-box-containing protein
VISADGRIIDSSAEGPQADVSDRAFYRFHAERADDDLHVGPPIIGRRTGRWGVSLTRRITLADGRFGGIVYLALDPAVFASVYNETHLGPQASQALIGLDGITRARRNGDKVSFGDDASRSVLFTELRKAPVGRYTATAASDGVKRLVSYRSLTTYPLVVVVASSLADVEATLAHEAREVYAVATTGTLLLLALAGLLLIAMRRDAQSLTRVAASEIQHRLLFENSFDAVLRTEPGGGVVGANAAACRLFGMDEATLRAAGREQLVDLADPRLPGLLAQRAAAGRAQGRLRMRRGDGSIFEAEVSSSLYRDGEGRKAASIIVRDLTAQQAAEAERQRLEARLRESQKLESVGTLAGGIAHDFNNILAAILSNTAMARQDLGEDHPAAEPLRRVGDAAARARALVQQILTFSRQQPEHRRSQPLQPLVEEALGLLRSTLPASARLEVHVQDNPLWACVDATQVHQVVVNLCTNAWQALPEQKGRVSVDLREVDAAAGAPGPGRWGRLRVADDGVGMDAATRERLFDPFFTTKPVGQGTGLGLAVVHGIVTAHSGQIAVHSAPGQGSTFDVFLPLTEAPSETAAPASGPAPVPQGRGEHVLYVDDDEVMVLTVSSLLQRAGYRVSTHTQARSAIEAVRANPQDVDVVVTDFNMPVLSGLEVAEAVLALRPGLPVVITSGYVPDELLSRAAAVGVRRVLYKEYTLEQLAGLVAEVLGETAAGATAAAHRT